jgi:hypothetical protein
MKKLLAVLAVVAVLALPTSECPRSGTLSPPKRRLAP